MISTLKKIKSYFCLTFLILLIILAPISLIIKTLSMYKELGVNFLIFMLLWIVLFFVFNYIYRKWQNKKQEQILDNSPFIELISLGFIIEENKSDKQFKYIHGSIYNYQVTIIFVDINFRTSEIGIFIEFNPKSSNLLLSNEDLNSLVAKYKKEKLIWKFHHVFYSTKIKNTELVSAITKIDDIIKILITENLQPISNDEINIIKAEIEELIELKTWHWKFL